MKSFFSFYTGHCSLYLCFNFVSKRAQLVSQMVNISRIKNFVANCTESLPLSGTKESRSGLLDCFLSLLTCFSVLYCSNYAERNSAASLSCFLPSMRYRQYIDFPSPLCVTALHEETYFHTLFPFQVYQSKRQLNCAIAESSIIIFSFILYLSIYARIPDISVEDLVSGTNSYICAKNLNFCIQYNKSFMVMSAFVENSNSQLGITTLVLTVKYVNIKKFHFHQIMYRTALIS